MFQQCIDQPAVEIQPLHVDGTDTVGMQGRVPGTVVYQWRRSVPGRRGGDAPERLSAG